MKNRGFIIIGLALLASCSGYFQNNNGADRKSGDMSLALADGSGYLSTDQYNEITPFVFRDKNTGKSYLFYASDKDGTYDIYYAEMNADGKFQTPVKLDAGINSPTAADFSPVLINSGGNIYLTYISGEGESTNLVGYQVDASFRTNAMLSFGSPSCPLHISAYIGSGGSNYMMAIDQYNYIYKYNFTTDWQLIGSTNTQEPNYSIGGYEVNIGGAAYDYFLYDTIVGGKHQLKGEAFIQGGAGGIIPFDVTAYSSSANDAYPFVDTGAGLKVYFASDRYGKGNYDLYRYNAVTFDSQIPGYLRVLFSAVYVAPSPAGNDGNSGLMPSQPLLTIQSAVDKAFSMGIQSIFLAEGVYTTGSGLNSSASGGVEFIGKTNLNIFGGFDGSFSFVAGKSILEGPGYSYPLIYFNNAENLILYNFTFRNSMDQGLYINNSTNIILMNSIITNNINNNGVMINNSEYVSFFSNLIAYNAGYDGGGFNISGSSNILISDCEITSNNVQNFGGGFYIPNSEVFIFNSTITSNYAAVNGGGILYSTMQPLTNNVYFYSNWPYDINSM